jgi:hypothetical protein
MHNLLLGYLKAEMILAKREVKICTHRKLHPQIPSVYLQREHTAVNLFVVRVNSIELTCIIFSLRMLHNKKKDEIAWQFER